MTLHAVGTGSVAEPSWRSFASPGAGVRLDHALVSALDAGRPIGLAGRASSPSGAEARRLAIDDLYGAAQQLKRHSGLDFVPVLPSRAELDRQLATASGEQSTTRDGRVFTNRFVVVDLRKSAGLVILLSTGSGSKLSHEGLQPFVVRAAQFIREHDLGLYAVKRFDRAAREDWGAGPVMIELRDGKTHLCDEDGLGPFDAARSIMSFIKGGSSRKLATDLPEQVRNGQRSMTGTRFEAGRVRYHAPITPPPGCASLWMKGDSLRARERFLVLDSPLAYPPAAAVASGHPEVRGSDGRLVDQVENVRFVLAKYGLPHWTPGRIHRELVARCFSTPGLRQRHGVHATIPEEPTAGRAIIRVILGHLQDYEEQQLTIRLGADVPPIVIEGFTPPDGEPWASPADFARIRGAVTERDHQTAKATRLTFAGLHATFNGVHVRMISEHARKGNRERQRRYRFVLASEYPDRTVVPDGHMHVDPELFNLSIVEALRRLDGKALPVVDPIDDLRRGDGLEDLRSAMAAREHEREAMTRRLEGLLARVEEVGDDGMPILQGPLLTAVQQAYNGLADRDLPRIEAELQRLQEEYDDAIARRPRAAEVSALLLLVDSLRNVQDRRYRGLWLASIAQLAVSTTKWGPKAQQGTAVRWSGVLRFGVGPNAIVLVPFEGSSERPPQGARDLSARANEIIGHLRAGRTCPELTMAHDSRLVTELRKHLGVPSPSVALPLLECDDPNVARIAVEVLLHRDAPVEDLARRLDVDPKLVDRIVLTHRTDPRRKWLVPRSPRDQQLLDAADVDGIVLHREAMTRLDLSTSQATATLTRLVKDFPTLWAKTGRGLYRVAACSCGARRWRASRLREVDGAVCSRCRRDVSGLAWPVTPYGRYDVLSTIDTL